MTISGRRLLFAVAIPLALTSAVIAVLRANDKQAVLPIKSIESITPQDSNIGGLIIWDQYLAWMGTPDLSDKNARVLLYNLDTKKTKAIAQGIYIKALTWVRASKDTVLYLAFDHLPCDDQNEKERTASGCVLKPRGWKLMAADVKTGKDKQIAKSSNELQQTYPILPEIEWPYVVWTDPSSAGASTPQSRGIVVYDLRENKSKVLVPGAITGRAAINEGQVIFSAAVPGPNKWDLFTVPADGSKPSRKLTSSGKVFLPRTANQAIAWQEPINSDPDAGMDSAIWTLPIEGKDEPVRISGRGNNPFPGNGFVVWLAAPKQGGQLLFSDLSKSKQPQILEPYPSFGSGWWVDGDRVAWATVSPSKDKVVSTIHVAYLIRG